nr:hypothetical protein [uncultured Marinifilum sp.]
MESFKIFVLSIILSLGIIDGYSQTDSNISIINNYNNWQWDSVFVAKNKFISLVIVPKAAGRILEYNLGNDKSLWVNPKLTGKSFAPTDKVKRSEWRNFGGYRLVPLPVGNCSVDKNGNKTKRWPPPAIIGDSPYKTWISEDSNGNQTIEVESGIQDLPVPSFDRKSQEFIFPNKIDEQLQYKRSLFIKEGTSLVHIKHTLINKGDKPVKRGIMTSSQHISRSKPELTDGQNYVAYIPFSERYKLPNGKQYEITTTPELRWRYINKNRLPLDKNNPEHVKKYFNHGTNWTGEVAPGIFEVHYDYYMMGGLHIISSDSWVCYVNKTNNTAFAKILEPYNSKLDYEFGTNISIYSSGLETGYLETEVRTPLYDLQPGKKFNYIEIHAAAKVPSLPIISINKTGIITSKLSVLNNTINGKYGVFINGYALLKLYSKSGILIESIKIKNVNPLESFILNESIKQNSEIVHIKLFVVDMNQSEHLLDSYTCKKSNSNN